METEEALDYTQQEDCGSDIEQEKRVKFTGRYYPAEYPEIGQIVAVKYGEATEDMFITCDLPEYARNGILLYDDIGRNYHSSTYRPSFHRVLAATKKDYLYVQQIDEKKGYIELSNKNLTTAEKNKAKEQIREVKKLVSFFNHWSLETGMDLLTGVLWKFFDPDMEEKVYGDLLKSQDWRKLVSEICPDPQPIFDDFDHLYSPLVAKQSIKFAMLCMDPEGIDIIKCV